MEGRHGVEMLADCVLTSGACDGRVALADAAAAVLAAVAEQDASDPAYEAPGGYCSWPLCSASRTLEWAYDDFAAARFAAAAGNASLAAQLLARAQSWRNVFDAAIPAVAPRRANSSYVEDASIWTPHPNNDYYTEGNAAQWMWSVPHNLSALAAAFPGGAGPVGGRGDSFAAQLQVVLANQTYWFIGTFLPNPYTWLGNEPSMLLPWSHAFAGPADSWRAAFWSRWHLRTYYTPTSDAIPGNDDYGASASGEAPRGASRARAHMHRGCARASARRALTKPRRPRAAPRPARRHALRVGDLGLPRPVSHRGERRLRARIARLRGRGRRGARRLRPLLGRRQPLAAHCRAQCECRQHLRYWRARQWRGARAAARHLVAALCKPRRRGAAGVLYGAAASNLGRHSVRGSERRVLGSA